MWGPLQLMVILPITQMAMAVVQVLQLLMVTLPIIPMHTEGLWVAQLLMVTLPITQIVMVEALVHQPITETPSTTLIRTAVVQVLQPLMERVPHITRTLMDVLSVLHLIMVETLQTIHHPIILQAFGLGDY